MLRLIAKHIGKDKPGGEYLTSNAEPQYTTMQQVPEPYIALRKRERAGNELVAFLRSYGTKGITTTISTVS